MRIFDQPEFSDLIISVNDIDDISPPKQYYLHQAVVLTGSKYLSILCAALPTEEGRKKLSVDGWSTPTIDRIFRWMYDDTEIKDDNLDLSRLGGLLEAAQIFQIEDFRTLIRQTAVELVASKHGAQLSLRIHERYWDEAERLYSMAEVKDWKILRGIVDKLPYKNEILGILYRKKDTRRLYKNMDPVTGKLWTGGYEDREFMKVFNNAYSPDIILKVGTEQNQRQYNAHEAIISKASDYLKELCQTANKEDSKKVFSLLHLNIDPEAMISGIRWIYGDSDSL
ncbi:hypothetical protein EYR41_011882 [Orbilia oligospora]|uniref:Uncharacterized protein n=1 Tax=Orbilia oligospora TaxID=2813651 RepID=A0A7C8PRG4_ORBOL|nr:hypothetical protein TWF751_003176 [Orbilia oligospora]TGJ62694.1 hypothetical protein EYR41_011882 [Orbilia oligospora]